ncbi:unnamed protein product [Schistosoma curassoni]|uniref:Secreted protein n=1 Tax=Schistosoma curassoni TaxID=6186 RepID=A0A183KQJ7_9TREM|nr:unnamed protein product [Schistosoma curassoni]
MFLSCKYAALALPIRAFTSASDPPCSSIMLPKYVKVFTSSKSSPSIVIGLVHDPVGYWRKCAPMVYNEGLPTPLGRPSVFTNPIKAPDVRFLFSQLRKQQ